MDTETMVMFWLLKDKNTVNFIAETNAAIHPDGTIHVVLAPEGLQALVTLLAEHLVVIPDPDVPEMAIVQEAPPVQKASVQKAAVRRRKSRVV